MLDRCRDKAEFPGIQRIDLGALGRKKTDGINLVHDAVGHETHLHAALQHTVMDPYQNDHAEIGIVPAIDQQGL